jgi:ParB family chromosome partitioning protein
MITPYEFHELCLIFPRCTDEELQLLVSDIRENGLQIPITLYEGKILDGRNRYLACQMLNKEPTYIELDGESPLAFVISRNLCRRHLTESQRAMVAAAIIELQRNDHGRSEVTISEAAQKLNVSPRLVNQAVKVINEGTDDDIEAIMSGEKKVRAVADEIREQNDFTLSPVNPKDLQIEAFEKKILAGARDVRSNMNAMFTLTRRNTIYKKMHRELRTIIFDE